MFQNKAKTVAEYLASLPPDRRAAISGARDFVRKHLPSGYVEEMDWGAITWAVPLSRFADTYNGRPLCYAALAATKRGGSLYLMPVYGDKALEAEFRAAFKRAGKKLDMGKSCVHFRTLDDLALDAVAKALASATPDEWIRRYEVSRGAARRARAKRGGARAKSARAAVGAHPSGSAARRSVSSSS